MHFGNQCKMLLPIHLYQLPRYEFHLVPVSSSRLLSERRKKKGWQMNSPQPQLGCSCPRRESGKIKSIWFIGEIKYGCEFFPFLSFDFPLILSEKWIGPNSRQVVTTSPGLSPGNAMWLADTQKPLQKRALESFAGAWIVLYFPEVALKGLFTGVRMGT